MSELENERPKDDREIAPPVMEPAQQAAPDHPAALSRDQENVIWNLQVLESGDHKLLAQILKDHPDLRDQIIERASQDLGNDTVAKALGVLAGVPEPEAPSEKAAEAPTQAAPDQAPTFDYTTSPLALEYDAEAKVKDHVDFMRANPQIADAALVQTAVQDVALATEVVLGLDTAPPAAEAAEAKEETPPQVIEESAKAAVDAAPQAEAQAVAAPATVEEAVEVKPAAEPEKESGWVSRAREYHQQNADSVAQFLAATGGACVGLDGAIDPNLVAQWQARHGVEADGRIGQQTNDAAVQSQPVTFEEAAKQADDDALPEPDPTDPRFAV